MSVWLMIISWLAAVRQTVSPKRAPELATAQGDEPSATDDTVAHRIGTVAQGQDHYGAGTRTDQCVADSSQTGRARTRVLRGPAIDGGTCWTVRPPPEGWPIHAALRERVEAGDRTIALADQWGEVVDLLLDRGEARGEVVLSTWAVRLGIRRRRAELQITADAAEVEGVEEWARRELPRALWWLRGVDASDAVERLLADPTGPLEIEGVDLGVSTRRIELATDVAGLPITLEMQHEIVTRSAVHLHQRSAGVVDGLDIGHRSSAKTSLGVYDKLAELARRRRAPAAALAEHWRDAGWNGAEPVTRVEARAWGDGLRLEGLDLTGPGAPFDSDALGRLWADSLTRHWRAEPAAAAEWLRRWRAWVEGGKQGAEPRLRDCDVDQAWAELRGAGGVRGRVRFTRAAAAAQLEGVRQHQRERLLSSAASIDVLEGEGECFRVLDDVWHDRERWAARTAEARARHADLIRAVRGGA